MSGRVTFRISLQPSNCWKSSSDGSAACNIVPIAPSATTTRDANASRRASARGFFDGPAEADEDTATDEDGKAAMKGSPWDATAVGYASSVRKRTQPGYPSTPSGPGGVPRGGRPGRGDGYHDIAMIR
ncbi:hypothetical protein GCM10010405_21780 [Streptomyces macrosporus]|uniref:DUF397 domain-containing protein n=1 Tax=Streptomyces macrosporus TaxID=44032 RepID=A0ABN3JUG4_9ACTN